MNKQVYLAGDMLSFGAQLQREKEAKEIRDIGLKVYAPQEDESINDKANVDNEGLAERIVHNDTHGIKTSDIIVIDCNENGKGTLVELGQIKGMKDFAKMVSDINHGVDAGIYDQDDAYDVITNWARDIVYQEVFPHNTDIRRANTSEQSGDRREFGVNQYVYGVALDLSDGKGFYELDEIYEELERIKSSTVDNDYDEELDDYERGYKQGYIDASKIKSNYEGDE
ncbi:nucleoside 2-deoxyribosyltransferase [Abyssicoccus albus]|uniref:Nucleoside 2-deoxyribosyltransferase-like protein n=1 Tax=Abyssicoccus albus TaxID=1817405 RepID=A0A3N5BBH9_9BACL|nr:nucleoside 2-deoxyribosyltransferase [Abyssicoccus albus]RPF54753.1 nucleoside 2-deoxyribosyltransferase-like protein [Abyssicoccus albus]